MNELQVVNKYHLTEEKRTHQRVHPRYVYIGRPSTLGNPFPITETRTRDEAVSQYKIWLLQQIQEQNQKVLDMLERIGAMVLDDTHEPVFLVCYCAPKPCHGDVIKEVILQAIEGKFNRSYSK